MQTGSEPRICGWDIDDLHYAGLEWGTPGGIPVLALHGWMDHADSFRQLAPRLDGCHIVAFDLSGQGLSSYRAANATYNIWDDLPQIAQVLDRLGWQDCVLLGHSRGANISSLFAAAQPERVRALVTLDSLLPEPTGASVVETLRAFIEETRKQTARPPRIFATRQDYIRRRGEQGNSPATAEALADRALQQVPEGYRLRGDPRLSASSAVKLSLTQIEDVLKAIRCPVLTIWATEGIKSRRARLAELARAAGSLVPDYEVIDLAGDHHFHLDPVAAGEIAAAILDFLNRHR